jgi:hypothetical protein
MVLYAPIIDKLNTDSRFNQYNNPNPQFLEITIPFNPRYTPKYTAPNSKKYCIDAVLQFGYVPIYIRRDEEIYPSSIICIHDPDYNQFLVSMVVTSTPTDENLKQFYENIDPSSYKEEYDKGKWLVYLSVQPMLLLKSSFNTNGHNIYTDVIFYMERQVLYKERRLYLSIPKILDIIESNTAGVRDYEATLIVVKTLLQLRFEKGTDKQKVYDFIINKSPSLDCWSECIRSLW